MLGAPTLQMSLAYDFYSWKAVDGDYSTISCTGYATGAWWAVDLSSPEYIVAINVTNLNDPSKYVVEILMAALKICEDTESMNILLHRICHSAVAIGNVVRAVMASK